MELGYCHLGRSTPDMDATLAFDGRVLRFPGVRCDAIEVVEGGEPRKKPRSAAEDRRMPERDVLPRLGSRRVLRIIRADVERLQLRCGPSAR